MDEKLVEVLKGALDPCGGFEGQCKPHVRWQPTTGHIPRGFGGAITGIDAVRLVLITAEPADPLDDETYSDTPVAMLEQHEKFVNSYMLGNRIPNGRFHTNLKRILELCWPEFDEKQRWAQTWYTNTVLCSATKSGGAVPREVIIGCGGYLRAQLALFPNAFRIALGGKSEERLQMLKIGFSASARHPSARAVNHPEQSWAAAADEFKKWRGKA